MAFRLSVLPKKKVILIRVQSYEQKAVDFAAKKIVMAAELTKGLNRNYQAPAHLPTRFQKWTVNQSPFIDKKSREQFERRTFGRLISISAEDETNATKFIEAIPRTMPSGVTLKITEHTFHPLENLYTIPEIAASDYEFEELPIPEPKLSLVERNILQQRETEVKKIQNRVQPKTKQT